MAHYEKSQSASRRRPKHYVEYVLLQGLRLVLRILPHAATLWLARRLGDFAFMVIRLRRRVTMANLRAALGSAHSEKDLQRIARACYQNFAQTFVEVLLFGQEPLSELTARMTIDRPAVIDAAREKGKGILYLTAHLGNWELFGACMGVLDEPIKVVVGDQRNLMADQLVNQLRVKVGMTVIPLGAALKEVMRTLRRGGRVALVADQDGGRDGVFLDFFGRPASTALGPGRFAYRTGAPIIIGFARRVAGGRHEAVLYPPIIVDRSRPEEEETRRILTLYSRALEEFVTQYPDQWFWMHRRWKTRPPTTAADRGTRSAMPAATGTPRKAVETHETTKGR